ncbi:MAG: hypothetical protein ABI336_03915 [Humibacillus sp.]
MAISPGLIVGGRWPAGLIALVGVALSLPSLVSPTWQQTVADRERGELLSSQQQWSWGRVELSGLTGVELSTVPNPVGLVVSVVLALAAAAAVVGWVVVRGPWAVAAPVGIALLAGRLLTTAAERHGRSFREEYGSEAGLTVTNSSTTVGWLETASVVVLLAALVLVVLRLLTDARQEAPETTALTDPSVGADPAGRHTERSTRAALRPNGAHLGGPEVGLSDDR